MANGYRIEQIMQIKCMTVNLKEGRDEENKKKRKKEKISESVFWVRYSGDAFGQICKVHVGTSTSAAVRYTAKWRPMQRRDKKKEEKEERQKPRMKATFKR